MSRRSRRRKSPQTDPAEIISEDIGHLENIHPRVGTPERLEGAFARWHYYSDEIGHAVRAATKGRRSNADPRDYMVSCPIGALDRYPTSSIRTKIGEIPMVDIPYEDGPYGAGIARHLRESDYEYRPNVIDPALADMSSADIALGLAIQRHVMSGPWICHLAEVSEDDRGRTHYSIDVMADSRSPGVQHLRSIIVEMESDAGAIDMMRTGDGRHTGVARWTVIVDGGDERKHDIADELRDPRHADNWGGRGQWMHRNGIERQAWTGNVHDDRCPCRACAWTREAQALFSVDEWTEDEVLEMMSRDGLVEPFERLVAAVNWSPTLILPLGLVGVVCIDVGPKSMPVEEFEARFAQVRTSDQVIETPALWTRLVTGPVDGRPSRMWVYRDGRPQQVDPSELGYVLHANRPRYRAMMDGRRA